MEKTYQGACHCGEVRYEVKADLAKGTGRCNCTFCAKVRNWSASVKPAEFRLLSDEKSLGTYRFKPDSPIGHHFCGNCGVRTHTKGHIAEIGGDFVSFAINTLEGVPAEELASLEIKYSDGLNNNWWNAPAVTTYL